MSFFLFFSFFIRVHSIKEPGSSILAFARVLGSISAGFPLCVICQWKVIKLFSKLHVNYIWFKWCSGSIGFRWWNFQCTSTDQIHFPQCSFLFFSFEKIGYLLLKNWWSWRCLHSFVLVLGSILAPSGYGAFLNLEIPYVSWEFGNLLFIFLSKVCCNPLLYKVTSIKNLTLFQPNFRAVT